MTTRQGGALRYATLALLVALAAALWLVAPSGAAGGVVGAGILVGFVIASWAFGILGEPVTTLVFFLFAVVFHVATPQTAFAGFSSTAWWLVFGGSITAVAVQTTGLGRRLAQLLFGHVAPSYPRCIAAVALAALGLAFVMPSTNGRILLLMPIVLAFAERLGLAPGRNGHTGLVLTAAMMSYMPPTTILPANVPNSILLGAAEQLYGVKLTYGPYLLLHFPILGVLKTVALVWLVCRLFPEDQTLAAAPAHELGKMSREERRLGWLLALSLVLFATDFLHGISPAWVALGTGILCLLPQLGILAAKTFSERVNVVTLLYIAGILGLGAVVAESGLVATLGGDLMHLAGLAPGDAPGNVAKLSTIGAVFAAVTTATGVPAVLTPLAGAFADATGLPLLTILMLQVPVFSTIFLPFESPPIMIGLQLGGVGVRPAGKLCLALAAITLLVLLPLDYLWWELLGYLP
jgi:di/tricarboxylate transporter